MIIGSGFADVAQGKSCVFIYASPAQVTEADTVVRLRTVALGSTQVPAGCLSFTIST